MNVVLIGYRGSGKTSVGRLLAGMLGFTLIDTDDLVVRKAGKTIREIFAEEGEAGFREREALAVAEAAKNDRAVIAAGGGAILRPENVNALRASGIVVWLQARAEVLFERIQADAATTASRPNLTAGGGLEEVRRLLEVRVPLYTAAAHHAIEVEGVSEVEAAVRIVALLPPEAGR